MASLPDPPFVVTVQGPRDCGKSTLIRSLIYHYTRQKLSSVQGTISLRTSKTTRLTFYECPPDMASMVDLAKVTDLAVLVIDASVGFQMQTFEFLNLLQHHGFPPCLGVLTRLDHYKDNKRQRKLKNSMKRRFWKEVGDGVKLFYLSGVSSTSVQSPLYKSQEIHNLARYLSFIKRSPLEWRQTHPYVLIDRFVPLSSAQLTQTVHFYGYVRGTSLKTSSDLHFIGLGDFSTKQVQQIDDPVPILDTRSSEQQQRKMKRALNLKERALYAPLAKLTTLAIDSESVTIPDKYVVFTKITDADEKLVNPTDEPGVKMVRALQEGSEQRLGQAEEKAELLEGIEFEGQERKKQKNDWKQNVKVENVSYAVDPVRALTQMIYESQAFQTKKAETEEEYELQNSIDTFRVGDEFGFSLTPRQRAYFAKKRCVTGQKLGNTEDSDEEEAELKQMIGKIEENKEEEEEEVWKTNQERRDEKIKAREQEGRFAFLNQEYGFIPKGAYVKCELEIEKKYVEKFEPGDVMVLCATESRENRLTLLRVKIKKHRWFPTILKNQDPLIISAGWRRFQTQPTYVTEDANGRHRMIKYTPKYGWCFGVFEAPQFPVKTPFVAVQTLQEEQNSANFRICATGVVLEVNQSYRVMKKLKLIGEPFKILRNTAFVKGMFSSKLEVAKYVGAQIRTVSGIRGQIKKEAGDDGTFRATFQDKILKSDIIFCRTWYSVDVPRFYNPAISYGKVRYLKSTSQLRRQRDLDIPVKRDSNYQEIKRDPKRLFQQLLIPDKLQKALPYKAKQKVKTFIDQDKIALRRKFEKEGLPTKAPLKIMMSENQRKVLAMVQRLSALSRQRKLEKKEAKQERAKKLEKKAMREEAKRAEIMRSKKKAKFSTKRRASQKD